MNTTIYKKRNWLIAFSVLPLLTFSQGTILQGETCFSNALFNTLLGIIIFLLIVLLVLSQTLKNISQSDFIINKLKEKKKNNANNSAKITGVILFCLLTLGSQAQAASVVNDKWQIGGLSAGLFYFMFTVILVEIIFLIVLLYTLHFLLRSDEPKINIVKEKKTKNILEILNASVAVEEEAEILMGHEYDGIRELDNDLPPWWKYGFYLTILVAVIYLIHYHVAYTGDLQLAEYTKEIEKGKADVAEYMKKEASNVDESTVKMLGANEIAQGKETFLNTCATCHGKLGEGGVGPNMTDEYWLHGGSLADIFKTIKYGWPDKGMKSWKEDLSPMQIAQVASFIRTLKGTNPPKGKAPQGDLYIEKAVALPDSLVNKKDSLQLITPKDSISKKSTPESTKK